MARKISPDLLSEHQGELGVWKKRKIDEEAVFETLLNFNFEITTRVVLGRAKGSGAIYRIHIPSEATRLVAIVCLRLCKRYTCITE